MTNILNILTFWYWQTCPFRQQIYYKVYWYLPGTNSQTDIKKMDLQQNQMRREEIATLKAEVKEELLLEITKLQAQMKATLIENCGRLTNI